MKSQLIMQMDIRPKLALCLFGQPRLVERGYENIKRFITEKCTQYDVDTFVHTWWDQSLVGTYYKGSPWRVLSHDELLIKSNTITKIRELYSPTALEYEKPRLFEKELEQLKETDLYRNSPDKYKHNANNTLSNLYSKYRVSELLERYVKETNMMYNIIISIRFDMLTPIILDIDKYISNRIYTFKTIGRFFITDFLIVFTDMTAFMRYSNAFNNLKRISSSNECKVFANIFGLEFVLNIEEIITLNLALYYSEREISNMVIFDNKINNFI